VLGFLWQPARYKVAYGGRGGAKSWNFARALLIQGSKRKLRILCARETMKSLADSVHKLLSDQIYVLGLGGFYRIEKKTIVGQNGTEFTFAGLRHDIASIKSTEGIDVCWVEEAQSVSDSSWSALIPTIRKDGSEIWISMNPDFADDAAYERWVLNPPPGAIVHKVGWRDNPWFPQVLRQEMEFCRQTDPDEYNHVWEGCCISLLSSAIYANELRAVDREGRILNVLYDPARPVDCFWDLGFGDQTAVWMVQSFPFEYRCIDYIEESGKTINWFLTQMQARGYLFGIDWLPWDLGLHAASLGSGKSVEELMRLAGRRVRIVPRLTVADGINAARTIFPLCYFDRIRTEAGVKSLRHYRYGDVKTTGHVSREPIHDKWSHGADAFRYFGLCAKGPKPAAAARSGRDRRDEAVGTWT